MSIKTFKLLQKNVLVDELVAFIEAKLTAFPKSTTFTTILRKKKNEDQHSLALCVFLTQQSNSKYYFARENAQLGASVIDIGVYHGNNLIFTLEAKLLPTPTGTPSSPRDEHEYVYGRGAGIQRFKDGKHGVNNENEYFREGGLIAYLKEEDFPFWFEVVNKWIEDAKWNSAEKLTKVYFNGIGKLKSIHGRNKSTNKVTLHHFWVKVA